MLWLFVGPTGVYLLNFFCSGIQFNLLLSSDGPMIDYSRKSVGLGFRLRQSIVK